MSPKRPHPSEFTLAMTSIGVIHTPFTERVSAPRQATAAADVEGTIELWSGHDFEHALHDLQGWDYVWVVYAFHLNDAWRPKVLPPRSDRRRGVFSTRSPHRPNPIGLSAVFGGSVPVTGACVDQQAALFAERCHEAGEAKCTYGTGAFMLACTGSTPTPSTASKRTRTSAAMRSSSSGRKNIGERSVTTTAARAASAASIPREARASGSMYG